MAEAYVDKFETQYRLPPGALTEQRRLDRLRARVLDKAFAQAFEHTGFPEEGELCIRDVVAPVCLSLDRTDESLTFNWSLAIAKEIARAIRDGLTANVVFYHSRRQALLDFAVSIARGDLRREWAWRQLGLWRSRDVASESESLVALVASLCAESELLVPTLRALAEAGWLSLIVHRLTEEQWEALAAAALHRWEAAHLLDESSAVPSPRALRNAMRVLNRSQLLWAITSSGSLHEVGAAACRAMAVLAVLDVEPMLLATETAQTMIGILAETVHSPRNETIRTWIEPTELEPTDLEPREFEPIEFEPAELKPTKPEPKEFESAESAVPDRLSPEAPDPLTPRAVTPAEATGTDDAEQVSAIEGQIESAGELLPAPNPQIDPAEEETKPIDLRRRALTRFGGLLFLLGVIDELKLPEEILNHELLGARPFAWVIHQLGLALVMMKPTDPAALAFAGLPPQATSPAEEEQPASELEVAALNLFVVRIVERLREALELEDESGPALLEFVCCRRAEVVADPGWIELRFSLDEVDTGIRRAGLDLDPGYVPWLGMVVKFIYE